MKRTSLARRNALLSAKSLTWGVGLVVLVAAGVGFRALAPNLFLQTLAPVFAVSNTISSSFEVLTSGFTDIAAIKHENATLLINNHALAAENRALLEKLADVTKLLRATDTKTSLPAGILAGVVARPPQSPYDTLVLAAGTASNITTGMEAFAQGGVPLGVVTSATKDFSRITLFSAPGTTITGWIGAMSTPITLQGVGGGAFTAEVARAAGISEGDVVFVPGPGKLPIGTVARVDGDPLTPSVTLRIVPSANLFSLGQVVVRPTGVSSVTFATSTAL